MKIRDELPSTSPLRPLVTRWDLDKTYLKTEFDTLRDLVRIPFESAEDKVNLPGVVALIRSLKESGRERNRDVRIHFISASPPQIGATIREKLELDGVEYDGIIFKDQLQNIVRGKFRNLREQVGYKLTALLASRRSMPAESTEILFGDDWESDPIIYSIYADVLGGRLQGEELRGILTTIGVDPELIDRAIDLCPNEPSPVVERIYIHLERRTPLTYFEAFGPRLVPSFNYLQTAACLHQDGQLTLDAVATVAASLIDGAGYTRERLSNSLADIERRRHLEGDASNRLRTHLIALGLLPAPRRVDAPKAARWKRVIAWIKQRWPRRRPTAAAQELETATMPPIDYPALVSEWRSLREGARA